MNALRKTNRNRLTATAASCARGVTIVSAALIFVGCSSTKPRCTVMVSNVSKVPVHSVVVELPDQQKIRFDSIGPDSSAEPREAPLGMDRITRLHMKAGTEPEELYEIDLRAPVPATFRGKVTFQVEQYNRIRVFVEAEARAADGGVLPWDTQPSWIASPNIPGMENQ